MVASQCVSRIWISECITTCPPMSSNMAASKIHHFYRWFSYWDLHFRDFQLPRLIAGVEPSHTNIIQYIYIYVAWVNLKHLSQRCRNADTNINIFHIDLYTVHNMYIYIYASKLNNVYCWDHPNGWLSKRPEQLIFGDCFYCSGSHRMDIYIYIICMIYIHTRICIYARI